MMLVSYTALNSADLASARQIPGNKPVASGYTVLYAPPPFE